MHTIDSDSFPLSSRRPRSDTRDDLLHYDPPPRIDRGRVYVGNDGDPLVTEANNTTEAFAEGCFAPNQVLHSETLSKHLDMGRRWVGDMEVLLAKARAAEGMGRQFTPATSRTEAARYRQPGDGPLSTRMYPSSGAQDKGGRACDLPPEPGGGIDGRPTKAKDARQPLSLLAAAARATVDYVTGLAPKRAAFTDPLRGTPVAAAKMTAAQFAALRVNKGRS